MNLHSLKIKNVTVLLYFKKKKLDNKYLILMPKKYWHSFLGILQIK